MAEKKNAKYFIFQDKPNLKLPDYRHEVPSQFAHRMIYLDSEVVPDANFYVETVWFLPRQIPQPKPGETYEAIAEPHTHSFDEFIAFFGTNPDDTHDLCGEVELWIDGEQHIIDKSFVAFIPAGLEHCPLYVRRVDRPIFHLTAAPTKTYE